MSDALLWHRIQLVFTITYHKAAVRGEVPMHPSPLVLGLTCWRRCGVPRQADAEGDLLVLGRYVEAAVIEVAVGFEQNLSEVPVAESFLATAHPGPILGGLSQRYRKEQRTTFWENIEDEGNRGLAAWAGLAG